MKTTKKLLAILLAVVLVMALATTAFATTTGDPEPAVGGDTVTISITRDSTYEGDDDLSTGRAYTWYKVFEAAYDTSAASGGGVSDGEPGAITQTPDKGIAYTTTNATMAADTANQWFTFTEVPDSNPKTWVVTWSAADSEWATVQAAAAWLKGYAISSGTLTYDEAGGSWSADVTKGYYIIEGTEGQNLVAATSNIDINEKNSYPTIVKEQHDEDSTAFADTKVNVAIGDVITYQITVNVPADANKAIVVTDTLSSGLKNVKDATADAGTSGATVGAFTNTDSGWSVTITPATTRVGGDVVITFTATVEAAALADLAANEGDAFRYNSVELKYNGDHYVMTDEVEYTTYYTGIEKIDGDTEEPLEGVKFTLKEGDAEFKVTKHADGYYYYDANGSSKVETDEDGKIVIRGLDSDKTYTLTETETNDGYNLLSAPATLSLVEDAAEDAAEPTDGFDKVENNKGSVLPSTGGIGTTIFYIVGTVLVLAAVVVLVAKKRVTE